VQAPATDIESEPLRMQAPVEDVGAGRAGVIEEAPIVVVPAFGARPMPSRECCRIVQKEETGVAARRHRLAPTSPELEPAGDPAAAIMVSADQSILPVKPAPIPKDEPSLIRLDQRSQRRDPVTQRHWTILTDLWKPMSLLWTASL
jgi:hypothetical protein